MDKKEYDNNSTITIGESIQANNKVLIRIMLVLVVFSALSFVVVGFFARCIKGLAESSEGVTRARNYQNEWVSDAIISIMDGNMTNETDENKCAFAQWEATYKGYKIKDKQAAEAFEQAKSIHDEIHQIYNANAGVTMQSDPEKAYDLIESIKAKNFVITSMW